MKFPKAYSEDKKLLNVIIETPYKSRNKFKYDEETGLFKLHKVLPAGLAFPCDMGFIPNTKGDDGDPLDALVLIHECIYPGNWVECRLLGVMEAEQKEKGEKKKRNDRFILVVDLMQEYDHLKDISDINKNRLQAIADFFVDYNEFEGKEFKLLGTASARRAHKLIKKQMK